jgi:casein kinase 1 epsilon
MADVSIIQDNSTVIITNDRFEILKKLGSGSFGEVFLAKDLQTNLLCAIKTERSDSKHPQLRIEQQIFLRMENCKSI